MNSTNCLAPSVWLHSSVGRASHRYRGGHRFESRWSPNFCQASFFQLLKLERFTAMILLYFNLRAEFMLLVGFCTCRAFLDSQPEEARTTFFQSWCPGRSPEILCWSDGGNFISTISKLVQLSDECFVGHMACHSFVAFFN